MEREQRENEHATVTQEVTQKRRPRRKVERTPEERAKSAGTNRLTERGGVSLVCFHLARLGYEYAITEPGCPFGDIWAQVEGHKIGIEVKTTRKDNQWHVKRRQNASGVDIYCLVQLRRGHCFVLTRQEVSLLIRDQRDIFDGIAWLPDTSLPRDSFNGWARLAGVTERSIVLPLQKLTRSGPLTRNGKPRAQRIVRKILADGSTKEYRYPAY